MCNVDHGTCRLRRFSVAIISERGTMTSELMPIEYDIVYGELYMMAAFLSGRCNHLDGTERSSQRAVRFDSAVSTVVCAMGAAAVR